MQYSPLLDHGRFFSFFVFYTVGRTHWKGNQPIARPLPAHWALQTQNKRTQKFMHLVGFEPTMPVFERAKTVHALDRASSVLGNHTRSFLKVFSPYIKSVQACQSEYRKIVGNRSYTLGATASVKLCSISSELKSETTNRQAWLLF
jgi:hypothetical protein